MFPDLGVEETNGTYKNIMGTTPQLADANSVSIYTNFECIFEFVVAVESYEDETFASKVRSDLNRNFMQFPN